MTEGQVMLKLIISYSGFITMLDYCNEKKHL